MSIKILLADDSITIQKVIGIIFGGDDYTLTVVDNGKAAIDKARELSPDVLLIDALMPGMSGYEVCESIRATPSLAAKPILILTGSFEPFDEDKAKVCGADDFLAKPFESQQIVNKVKELYELGATRASASQQTGPMTEPPPMPEPPPLIPVPPVIQEPPVIAQQAIDDQAEDIWGAFTVDEEPVPVTPAAPEITEAAFEPDVFAIISEEPEAQITQPSAAPATQTNHTGSQWVPVEEHTFEFAEETISEMPSAVINEQEPSTAEISFGDISFDEEPLQVPPPEASFEPVVPEAPAPAFEETTPSFTETIIPAFTESVIPAFEAPAPIPAEPATAPVAPPATAPVAPPAISSVATPVGTAAAAAALTEEQLKAAIASVSQEVIQRIVWEVVPDLAEVLIKDAIRKIKEGL